METLSIYVILLLSCLPQLVAEPSSSLTVVGAVYCDLCLTNAFSTATYFMPGVDVHIQCRFNVMSPKTAETISISVNRSTDSNGVYKLEIPSVDGVDCIDGPPIQSFCQATLIRTSSTACNIPALKTTTNEISVKSKLQRQCIYCFTPLSFKPATRNHTLCRRQETHQVSKSGSKSKFLLPPNYP